MSEDWPDEVTNDDQPIGELIEYWEELAGGSTPLADEVDPTDLAEVIDDIVVADALGPLGEFRICFAGDGVARRRGIDPTDLAFEMLVSDQDACRVRSALARCQIERLPVILTGIVAKSLESEAEDQDTCHLLLLPLLRRDLDLIRVIALLHGDGEETMSPDGIELVRPLSENSRSIH